MNPLPTAIEHSLIEAGCSPTEIILIQHMLGGQPTTLRVLAQKTGKSTGVLDQAMKKLMKKGVVVREQVNENPKFVMKSLQNIVQWLHDETLHRRELLLRKYQTFEAFVASMEKEQSRPEMKFFEGDDGIEQAFFSLLGETKTWRQYALLQANEQDDPLWQMRVRLFRARKEHKIFSRVIAQEGPMGAAFQKRDDMEFRETVLLPAEALPITFEKIITDRTVACIQVDQKRACFVRFPEQVSWETSTFDLLWEMGKVDKTSLKGASTILARSTLTEFATLRLFWKKFCSKKRNLICMGALCLGIIVAGLGVHQWRVVQQENYVRQELLTIVTNGAKLFSTKDLDEIQTTADMRKPQYKKTVALLQKIRSEARIKVNYVYLMRPTAAIGVYTFLADADTIDPTLALDINQDGQIDEADEYALPGRTYVTPEGDALAKGLSQTPQINTGIIEDQWGKFYSASAPIFDQNHEIKAFLGVDILVR